jgi:hypothetical protein
VPATNPPEQHFVETKQARRLRIWNEMTPERRDYDRFIAGQIPQGASWVAETPWGRLEGARRLEAMTNFDHECQGCTCFRNPPCFHCEENHRDHEHDDHEPVDEYVLEMAAVEAHEEQAARERSAQWAAYAASHPSTVNLIEV